MLLKSFSAQNNPKIINPVILLCLYSTLNHLSLLFEFGNLNYNLKNWTETIKSHQARGLLPSPEILWKTLLTTKIQPGQRKLFLLLQREYLVSTDGVKLLHLSCHVWPSRATAARSAEPSYLTNCLRIR